MDKKIIAQYYKEKSHIEVNDEFHKALSEGDIDIMRKSFGYVLVTPFLSFLFMYLAKGLKKESSMSSNFAFSVRNLQDRFMT